MCGEDTRKEVGQIKARGGHKVGGSQQVEVSHLWQDLGWAGGLTWDNLHAHLRVPSQVMLGAPQGTHLLQS